jgi:hypothetical protein
MAHATGEEWAAGRFRFVVVMVFMAGFLMEEGCFIIAAEVVSAAGYGR